ncbi:MAG: VOC family protein [Pseudomonadota bacterium]
MTIRGALVAIVLAGSCIAAPVSAESPVAAGYQEAVFSVSNIDAYQEFLQQVAGWQVIASGPVDARMLSAWGLPAAASAREVLVGNPGTTRGYIRLIQFEGVEQVQIRSNAQSWDTGGWFDVNSRVRAMGQTFDAFQSLGWQATSDPVTFSFGKFVVTEWLARGPDGIVIAVIERIAPPLEGWPQLQKMSRIFNATQIVSDIDAARWFYFDVLGFEPYLTHESASKEAGPNVLGIPHNLATQIVRRVTIASPAGDNEGSVELLAFDGLTGADFSARSVPPNLGILMLRFPVKDMNSFYARMQQHDVTVAFAPVTTEIKPYGNVRLMAVRGPDGVWIEFYEQQQ